jgi:sortase A
VSGIALLLVYGAALVHRNVGSRIALRSFQQGEAPEIAYSPDENLVDWSLWSEHRVAEYRRALLLPKNSTLATIRIRRLNLYVPVFADTDELSLNRGAGWISGTALPGNPGNIGIAGHRDSFFRVLKDIALGDRIELSTLDKTITYNVEQTEIVNPDDVSVLKPGSRPALTLVTCFPFYFVGSAPKRFIVHAGYRRPVAGKALTQLLRPAPLTEFDNKERDK